MSQTDAPYMRAATVACSSAREHLDEKFTGTRILLIVPLTKLRPVSVISTFRSALA